MFRTVRFLATAAFLAATSAPSASYAADVPDPHPLSYQSEARHVVDRWFVVESDSPANVHERYLDAINRGDAAAASAAFSPNAMYHGGGCQPDPCVGLTAIAQEIHRSVLTNRHTILRSADVSGDRLLWSGDLDSDLIRATGFDHVATLGTMLVDGDLILDYRVWFDNADPLTALYVEQSQS